MSTNQDKFKKIVSHAKEYGFIFQSSEIYGGLASTWDYGPLGVELKRNIKDLWWKSVVSSHDNVVGMDSAILCIRKYGRLVGMLKIFMIL